jgi:UDP:flavonoid glycosyltransferase YjiC (YdhE family)
VVYAGAGLRLEPSTTSEEIAAAARHVLADDTYRRAAERIAAAIAEETATDLAVAEIEEVLATAPQPSALFA